MDRVYIFKSTQEQAVASWVNYLNQVRLDKLTEALSLEQHHLQESLQVMKDSLAAIQKDIIDINMGGKTGMHGFIAEAAECGIGNARRAVEGLKANYIWLNDGSAVDLVRDNINIQQKFVNSQNHLSLQAIRQHLEKYPDFLKNGGKYQIPKDHYDKIQELLSISEKQANKMPTDDGTFSLSQWKFVHTFFQEGRIPLDSIEPSQLEYSEVQKDVIDSTYHEEKQNLRKRNKERRDAAYQNSKPTLQEGMKAAAFGAGLEGAAALGMEVYQKHKTGMKLADYETEDWMEIVKATGDGLAKGGVRGASLYILSNYTATPASVANALVTSAIGIAEQAHQLRKSEISETEFIANSEMLCLDAAVSAVSTIAGQLLIPIPMVGPLVGNIVGTTMYQLAKEHLSKQEQEIIGTYIKSLHSLEGELAAEFQSYLDQLNRNLEVYMGLLDRAFLPNIPAAFAGSTAIAESLGISSDSILKNKPEIDQYFLY